MSDRRSLYRPAVVVTGGSSGIGAEVCRAAARQGWHVWVGYDNGRDRAMRLAAEVLCDGGSAAPVALPLGDVKRLRDGIATIAQHVRATEAAILCGAPAPDIVPFAKLEAEHFRRHLDAAIVGNHALMTALWRHCFRQQGGGHLLAVLSAAQGPPATPHMASYVAAKGGFEALLRAAAAELGPAGLRVSVVRPGFVETPMLQAFEPRLLERARTTAPGQRFLRPGDVAMALLQGLQTPPLPGAVAELELAPREVVT